MTKKTIMKTIPNMVYSYNLIYHLMEYLLQHHTPLQLQLEVLLFGSIPNWHDVLWVRHYISKDYREVTDTSTKSNLCYIKRKHSTWIRIAISHISTVVIIIITHDLIDSNLTSAKNESKKGNSLTDGTSN